MWVELRHLRYFLSVAEHLSFTHAAEKNFVAQSSLSQQIAGLEKELGAQLFFRGHRHVSLTGAGELLAEHARRILWDVDILRMDLDAYMGVQKGTLRLGLVQTPTTSLDVAEVMREYHERFPGIRFDVVDDPSEAMVAAIEAGALDVALVGLGPDEIPEDIDQILVAREPLVAAVSSDSPLAQHSEISVEALVTDHQFIHFSRGTGLRRRVEAAFARAGLSPEGTFHMGQLLDMVRLASRGVGVTIVPQTMVREAQQISGLPFCAIPLTDSQANHPISLIYKRPRASPATRAFVDIIQQYLA